MNGSDSKVIEPVRVTEVIDWVSRGELLEWRGRVGNTEANRVSKAALKRGTEVHEAVSSMLMNQTAAKLKSEESKLAFGAWLEWWKLQNLEGTRTVEVRITNEEYGITGQPDFHTENELFDWKVSKRPKWTWGWQCNAYLWLLGRLNGKYRIVQLHPELGTWDEHKGIYSQDRMDAFLGLVKAYRQWKEDTNAAADREIEADQKVAGSEDIGSGARQNRKE